MRLCEMSDVIVAARDLTKRFGDFTAVDHVNFKVRRGDILGYLGPNGSGKTTTLRMLLGILLPDEGSGRVLGYDIVRQAETIRTRVGYMSQKFALYDELTVWENLSFYAGVYGVQDDHRLGEVMDLLGLAGLEKHRAGDLPIGWRQRLALATAIAHRPPLLILDEPTSGVDPIARRAFWDLIYTLTDQGVTAFVTTHYMDEAEYCNRVGIMRRGRLLALDTPSALKERALPGLVWDVHAEPMLEALEALEAFPDVTRAGLAGDHLRAITDRSVQGRDLQERLSEQGLEVPSVAQIEPTLEDVFLALAGE
jgi:ABC-2 type transport system ATP-binding protein